MINQALRRKLEKRDALDVRKMGREVEPGRYQLAYFIPDVDYCDAEREAWIWSIGEERATGLIYASTRTEYYENPLYKCLWLR